MPPKRKEVKICPKCGRPYSYIKTSKRGDREYAYAVHIDGKKRRYCYLGPVDTYVYVTTTHLSEGITFFGMMDRDRIVKYLQDITQFILLRRDKLTNTQKKVIKEVIDKLKSIVSKGDSNDEVNRRDKGRVGE